MQVCDPPISVVLLFSQVMPVDDPGAPYIPEENDICAAVLDRDGITMGLVWDTAAALLRNSDSRHWNFRMSFGVDSRDLSVRDGDAGDSDDGSDSGEEDDRDGDRSQDDGGEETGRRSISDEDADNEGGNGSGDDESGEDAPASTRVLAIPELLENILSFLPEGEIITSVQRVSRTWRSSVVDSPRIQRKLFLPKGNKPAAVWPVRLSRFGDDGIEDEEFGIPIYKQSVAFNSLLGGRNLYPECDMIDFCYTSKSQAVPAGDFDRIHDMMIKAHPGGKLAFSHDPNLSWRSMQLCNSPIAVANMEAYSENEGGLTPFTLPPGPSAPDIDATLFDRDGITMGLAYDTGVAMLGWEIGKEDPKVPLWINVIFGIHHTLENSQSAIPTQ
jgi:hypothetical protein